MPVSISKIFDIQGQVVAPVTTPLSLDICAFSNSGRIPTGQVLNFNSAKSVSDFFGAQSDITKYANIYFKGYDGSQKKPSKLLISRWVEDALPGYILGSTVPPLSQLATVGECECVFRMTDLTGTLKNITITNFDVGTNATSYANLAVALQDAITVANNNVEICNIGFNPDTNAYYINDILTGARSKVLPTIYPTTATQPDLGAVLGFADPAVVSSGSDAQTPQDNIDNVINQVSNFVGFVFFYEVENQVNIDVAEYLDTLEEDYAFFLQTSDPNSLIENSPISIANQVSIFKNVYCQYGTVANTVFSSSIGACIDYVNNLTINWAYKSQTGLIADITDDASFDALLTNGYNFYSIYGLKAQTTNFLYNGKITGIYNFIDNLYNFMWLKDSLQRDLVTLFTSVGAVSYTPQGYAVIKSALQNTVNQALNNNVISIGLVLSSEQKTQLQLEFGEDISSVLENNGYLLIVSDPGAQARINRQSPICKLVYTYGGGINQIVLDAIQVQ